MRDISTAATALANLRKVGKAMLPLEAAAAKIGGQGMVVVIVHKDGFTSTIHRLFDKTGTREERRTRRDSIADIAANTLKSGVRRRALHDIEKAGGSKH